MNFLNLYKLNKKSFSNNLKTYRKVDSSAFIMHQKLCEYFDVPDFDMKEIGKMFFHKENPEFIVNLCKFCNKEKRTFLSFEKGYSEWCSLSCSRKDSSKTDKATHIKTCEKMHKKTKELLNNPNSDYRKKLSIASSYYMNLPESKERASNTMRRNIASGKMTPAITNTWTHWDIECDGKKFRSSFEAIFFMYMKINKHDVLYESLRIEYFFEDKNRTYIVDFVDHDRKIIYEIKPKIFLIDPKVKAKKLSAELWCMENGYKFEYITESDIINMASEVCHSIDNDFTRKFKAKYARHFNPR